MFMNCIYFGADLSLSNVAFLTSIKYDNLHLVEACPVNIHWIQQN